MKEGWTCENGVPLPATDLSYKAAAPEHPKRYLGRAAGSARRREAGVRSPPRTRTQGSLRQGPDLSQKHKLFTTPGCGLHAKKFLPVGRMKVHETTGRIRQIGDRFQSSVWLLPIGTERKRNRV